MIVGVPTETKSDEYRAAHSHPGNRDPLGDHQLMSTPSMAHPRRAVLADSSRAPWAPARRAGA